MRVYGVAPILFFTIAFFLNKHDGKDTKHNHQKIVLGLIALSVILFIMELFMPRFNHIV